METSLLNFIVFHSTQTLEESILGDFKENFPFLFWVLAGAAFVGLATFKISRFHFRFEKMEKEVVTLTNRLDSIDNRLGLVENKLGVVITYLAGKGLDLSLFAINSPVELNAVGHRILKEMGGKKYVDTNVYTLIKLMESKFPKTGFDVQSYALVLIFEKIEDLGFIPIKNYIFQNPFYRLSDDKSIPLDLTTVTQIMGIYLRDKYFEKYPSLKEDTQKL